MKPGRLILVFSSVAFSSFLPLFAATTPPPPKLRLGDAVVPTRYTVSLDITPGESLFHGAADIDIEIRHPSQIIWLNATGLNVHTATAKTADRTLTAQVIPGGNDFMGLSFSEALPAGPAHLHFDYEGHISKNSSAGVFELKEGDRWYVYTQFEPTDARRAFPCFDEPSFKVPWQVSLDVPKGDMALSNTPQTEEKPSTPDRKTVRFAVSKPLPSYLVAFAVGQFDAVKADDLNGVPLRVITPHGRGGEAQYVAKVIPQLLKRLEDYFGRPYPYEKLDSVVMPISNFAMENAALITYSESLLLSKPENDSIHRQRLCASVVAHEMAHQWFGDLVTTAWWNDIWLNEAFATWMEGKIVGEWRPEWNMDVDEVNTRLGAMRLDSLASTRKIRQPIESESDIANAFDDITYSKGAAVIRMFESWIGPETFRKGVRLYLNQHAWGNATTPEFLAAISTAAGRDIAPAFNTFLDQPGVPLVSVKIDCGSGTPKLDLAQRRSLPIGSPADSATERWQVPVCVKYASDGTSHRQCMLFADPRAEMPLTEAKSCPTWVLANDRGAGYYRAGYDDQSLKSLLADQGKHLRIAERVSVLGDARALTGSGDLAPSTALSLASEFAGDPDKDVTESSIQLAEILVDPSVPADLRAKAADFIQKTYGPRARELGWTAHPGDSDDTRLLRRDLVPFEAEYGHDRFLIADATTLALRWLKTHAGVDAEMLPPLLNVAAAFGNRALFDQLHQAALETKEPRQRHALLSAMGHFRDPAIVKTAMNLLLTKQFDARQSFGALLLGPTVNPDTRELPFDFVRANLDKLLSALPREVGGDFAADLPRVGNGFCTTAERAELNDFFAPKIQSYTGGPRNLAQTLEKIDLCVARRKALGPDLARFLEAY